MVRATTGCFIAFRRRWFCSLVGLQPFRLERKLVQPVCECLLVAGYEVGELGQQVLGDGEGNEREEVRQESKEGKNILFEKGDGEEHHLRQPPKQSFWC